MEKRKILLLSITVLLITAGVFIYLADTDGRSPPNYEAIGVPVEVSDGDTMTVRIKEITDPHRGITEGRDEIRFAKIDTEELSLDSARKKHDEVRGMTVAEYENSTYYQHAVEARELLKSYVEGYKLYIDFDDLAEGEGPQYEPYRGNYGRIIAAVYIKENNKWINLNAVILREYFPDYVDITGYSSEFEPRRWLNEK